MLRHFQIAAVAALCALAIQPAAMARSDADGRVFSRAEDGVREARVQGTTDKIRYRLHGKRAMIDDMNLGDEADVLRDGAPNIWHRERPGSRAGIQSDAVSLVRPGGSVTKGVKPWSDNTVYYEIDASLNTAKAKQAITDGMAMISNSSAIKFVPRTTQANYISFFAGQGNDAGCWSSVGMRGGKQQLSLSDGCHYAGIAAHEMLHALGWHHEQSRADRDEFVKILFENITAGQEHNFEKLSAANFDAAGPFDFDSIMLYRSTSFSKNGKPTIEPVDKSIDPKRMGQRTKLSTGDILSLKTFYPASSSSSSSKSSAKSSSSSASSKAASSASSKPPVVSSSSSSSKSSAKSSSSSASSKAASSASSKPPVVSSSSSSSKSSLKSSSSASSKSSAKSSSSSASSKSSSSSSSGGTLNAGLKITYAVTSDWATGFCADATVTNTSSKAINAWRGSFVLDGAKIRNSWNASMSQAGNVVSVVPAAYLSNIAAGATIKNIGFCANRSSTASTALFSASSSHTVSGGVSVSYSVSNVAGNEFCTNLLVKNTSGKRLSGWRGSFNLSGAKLSKSWNAAMTQTGSTVSFVPAEYLTTLESGATVNSIGFCATR